MHPAGSTGPIRSRLTATIDSRGIAIYLCLLYGQTPSDDGMVFLGNLALKGERGLLKLPAEWLLRSRYTPFYDYLQSRVLEWVADASR